MFRNITNLYLWLYINGQLFLPEQIHQDLARANDPRRKTNRTVRYGARKRKRERREREEA